MFNRYAGVANTYGAHVDGAVRYAPGGGLRVRTDTYGKHTARIDPAAHVGRYMKLKGLPEGVFNQSDVEA